MPARTGPRTSSDALQWIQEAVAAGRYMTHPHLHKRLRQRDISLRDVKRAISLATSCIAYPDRESIAGGTSWRVTGPAIDGTATAVGVEAFMDHLGERALLITVF